MHFMSLVLAILKAVFFLIVLALSSELLAKGAEILEDRFGAGFVGSVILGFITMLPELIFVLIAVKASEVDVALGSAIGGNILLFTFGLGLVILLAFWKHGQAIQISRLLRDDLAYLFVSSIIILIFAFDHKFQLLDGLILIGIYLVFIIHQYWETKKYPMGYHPDDKQYSKTIENANMDKTEKKNMKQSIFYFIIGGVGILVAAEPFVESLVEISFETGIPALFLSLIISPLASEMPEKISALILTIKSMTGAEMAVANFIGSKIQANSLLFGAMIVYFFYLNDSAFPVGDSFIDIMITILVTILGVYVFLDLKLNKKEGILVFILYILSLIVLYFF